MMAVVGPFADCPLLANLPAKSVGPLTTQFLTLPDLFAYLPLNRVFLNRR